MKKTLKIYVDSEWDSNEQFLLVQVFYEQSVRLYFNSQYPALDIGLQNKLKEIYLNQGVNVTITPWDFKSSLRVIDDVLSHYDKKISMVEICFFFSIMDLYALYSNAFIIEKLSITKRPNCIYKTTNIRGSFKYNNQTHSINDLHGWGKSLKILQDTVNYPSNYKELNVDKSKMELVFDNNNNELMFDFYKYAIEDVISLRYCEHEMLRKLNDLYTNTFGFPDSFLVENSTMPKTLGSIGANLLEKFVYYTMSLDKGLFNKEKFKNFDQWNLNLGIPSKLNHGKKKKYNLEKRLTLNNQSSNISTMLNAASVKTLASLYVNSTGIFNALIQGGRTINENPEQIEHSHLLDIDFQSCYGSALSQFTYPVGLPTVYARSTLEKSISLGVFLKNFESELVDNLYTIVIKKQNLSFKQDLLYSKMIEYSEMKNYITKKTHELGLESDSWSADFVLLTHELDNTIITSDILNAIRKTANNKEFGDLMSSEVITACYYAKSDYLDANEYADYIKHHNLSQSECYKYDINDQNITDLRPRKWTGIKLNRLIDPLLGERKKLKELMSQTSDDEMIKSLNNQQIFYKNLVNIIYGVLASMHFNTSNAVLANVITARARLNIWMVSKVLLTRQSITDGGLYSPLEVIHYNHKLNDRKPGLEKLANFKNLNKLRGRDLLKFHRNIKITTLGGIERQEWINAYENADHVLWGKIDAMATQIIDKFWNVYDLHINYKLEHKQQNTSKQGFTILKGHYALKSIHNDELIFKFRGLSLKTDSLYKQISRALLYEPNLEVSIEEFKNLMNYSETSIQTINDYLKSKYSKKLENNLIIEPGKKVLKEKHFRLRATDLTYRNKIIYKKVIHENVDIAQSIIDSNTDSIINLRNFILKCNQERIAYFELKNKN